MDGMSPDVSSPTFLGPQGPGSPLGDTPENGQEDTPDLSLLGGRATRKSDLVEVVGDPGFGPV